MRVLITGVCGFVGSTVARHLRREGLDVMGIDSLVRAGSETNRASLAREGIDVLHGDVRVASDLEALPAVDWVVDAAANPSVLAGLGGDVSSRQVVEHNLIGTLHVLEYCKRVRAGFLLLSTSRVYSLNALAAIPLRVEDHAFRLAEGSLPSGVSLGGIDESFSTESPLSLYGATKRCSEVLALEYASAFDVPVLIDRCSVLAGPGQFGKIDQGIFSYWVHAWRERRPLRYIGYGGLGHQVRDGLHVEDLATLVAAQLATTTPHGAARVVNVGGGPTRSMSLSRLSAWCRERFGYDHRVEAEPAERRFDVPWVALDSSVARDVWKWSPKRDLPEVLGEIADFAMEHPNWLSSTSRG